MQDSTRSRSAVPGSRVLLLLGPILGLGCGASAPPAEQLAALEEIRPRPSSSSDAPEAGVLAAMQRHIAEREYRASENDHGLQAPNRRHGLRTYFEPSGIRVHDRTPAAGAELLGLTLARMGRGERLTPVAPGEVSGEDARVEVRRPGLLEWYVNSPAGLEQGFTLPERPEGEGALTLELALSHARASLQGERVILATSTGRRLAYGKLVVLDARGAEVSARLEVPDPDRVHLVVADAGARYPLTIDPLLTETADAQIVAGQGNSQLGTSVAAAGDVNGDGYDDVIVGAAGYDGGGAAFIFLGSASGIPDGSPPQADTQLVGDQLQGGFGTSVAGAGDINGDGYDDVIVGANFYDSPENAEGAAFIFLGSASGIADGGPATASGVIESNQENAQLGVSVAGAGDVNDDGYDDVIVGARGYDPGGAAFVFLGSAAGITNGTPATAATQLSNPAGGSLGVSVAGAGDIDGDGYDDVIVGASFYSSNQSFEGAAFVFLGGPSGIPDGNPATAEAQLESDQADAHFGSSVAGAGDVNGDGYDDVIVGAVDYDTPATDEGAAFVFLGSASGMPDGTPATAAAQLDSNQTPPGSLRSVSVAGLGDVDGDGYGDVIVGAKGYDVDEFSEGAAFVFFGSSSGIADGNAATADVRLESDQKFSWLGQSVAGAGDVNGDGFPDVIVGAQWYETVASQEGAAFVFHGGPPPPGVAQCDDGLDNDGDGSTDTGDADCADPSDPSEFHISPRDILAAKQGPLGAAIFRVAPDTGFVTQVAPIGGIALEKPSNLLFDRHGGLLLSDPGASPPAVLRLDLEAGTAQVVSQGDLLVSPRGMVEDPFSSDILVADAGAALVIRIDPSDGSQSAVPIVGALCFLTSPTDLSLSVDSDLLIADSGNGNVWLTNLPSPTVCTRMGVAGALQRPASLLPDGDVAGLGTQALIAEFGSGSGGLIIRLDLNSQTIVQPGAWSFVSPRALARERDGHLLVAHQGGKLDRLGEAANSQVTLATLGGGPATDIAVVPSVETGDIVVMDSDRVMTRVDPLTGEQLVLHSGSPFASPFDVVTEPSGHFLVSNSGLNRGLQRVDRTTFAVSTVSSGGNFGVARYLAFDETTGDALMCKQGGEVFRIDLVTGTQTAVNSGAQVGWCEGVAVNSAGEIVVVDRSGDRLVYINPGTGAETPLVPGPSFTTPIDLEFEDLDHVVVTDTGSDLVTRVNIRNRVQTTIATGQGLAEPRGVEVMDDGKILVADRVGGLLKFDPLLPSNANVTLISENQAFGNVLGVSMVPEPAALPGLAFGSALLALLARRRSRQPKHAA